MTMTSHKLPIQLSFTRKLRRWWMSTRREPSAPSVTKLSARDSLIVARLLDNEDAEPNDALKAAAARFK